MVFAWPSSPFLALPSEQQSAACLCSCHFLSHPPTRLSPAFLLWLPSSGQGSFHLGLPLTPLTNNLGLPISVLPHPAGTQNAGSGFHPIRSIASSKSEAQHCLISLAGTLQVLRLGLAPRTWKPFHKRCQELYLGLVTGRVVEVHEVATKLKKSRSVSGQCLPGNPSKMPTWKDSSSSPWCKPTPP